VLDFDSGYVVWPVGSHYKVYVMNNHEILTFFGKWMEAPPIPLSSALLSCILVVNCLCGGQRLVIFGGELA
jgi:hypothetical protein